MKCGFLGLMVMCWVGLQSYAQDPDFWQFEGLDTLYRKVEGFGVGLPQEKVYRPHAWASFGTQDTQAADYAACKFYGPLYK